MITEILNNFQLELILRGYTFKDKLKIIYRFFILVPLRKLGFTKKEILITMKNDDGIYLGGDKTIYEFGDKSGKVGEFLNLKKGVFIDVGANLGKYTIMVGKKLKENGTVISIEPEKQNIKLLNENIKINGLKNVIVIEKACSNKNGKSTLYLEGTTFGGTSHSLEKHKHHVGEIIVDIETLDSIISKLKFKRVNLVKIDVEGSELEVLHGAEKIITKYHPKIICESFDKESEEKITNFLKKFKYQVKRIDTQNIFAY